MREVAALAGVSLKTVSRVINAEPGVSPELAARVGAAIQRLAYRHNLWASSLRRTDGKSATIGLILEDIGNPFSATLHRAIEDVAVKRGVLVLAGSLEEDEDRERELVSAFASRRVDGLVIMPPAFLDADTVLTDNLGGARRGVRHLVEHGHQRIACLVDLQSIQTAALRYQGYREELEARNLTLDPGLVRLDLRGIEHAEAEVMELLAQRPAPTAIFAAQNLLTIGACRALRRRGLHHQVALVGFDDILLADLLDPGITVVAQDPAAMGRTAAELLFFRLDGDRTPTVHRVIPTRLIERGSGEITP